MNKLSLWILKLRNWSIWEDYKNRVIDKNPVCDYKRGVGYYLETGLYFINLIEIHKLDEFSMKSGKTGLYKLIDYTLFSDPYDMIKESDWQFLGYKREKLIDDMSFEEYLKFVKSILNEETK